MLRSWFSREPAGYGAGPGSGAIASVLLLAGGCGRTLVDKPFLSSTDASTPNTLPSSSEAGDDAASGMDALARGGPDGNADATIDGASRRNRDSGEEASGAEVRKS
jgi:hypothetical protein